MMGGQWEDSTQSRECCRQRQIPCLTITGEVKKQNKLKSVKERTETHRFTQLGGKLETKGKDGETQVSEGMNRDAQVYTVKE